MGFLPLIYGCLLVGLSSVATINLFVAGQGATQRPPMGKPLLLLAAVTAAVVGMEPAGFVFSIFLMLAFMYGVVERRPVGKSLLVSAMTTGVLFAIFATWLGVPLPKGPWGF